MFGTNVSPAGSVDVPTLYVIDVEEPVEVAESVYENATPTLPDAVSTLVKTGAVH